MTCRDSFLGALALLMVVATMVVVTGLVDGRLLTARGESLAAFDGRCIPAPAALLLAQILPVFSVVAPCRRGASPVSVRRQTFTTGC
jgi:hypothetical protein